MVSPENKIGAADIEFIKKLIASTGGAINSFVKKITKILFW